MKRYRIHHITGFKYSELATASYNEIRMLPAREYNQIVLSSQIEIQPNAPHQEFTDFFNTRVVAFDVLEEHHELNISASNLVEVRSRTTDALEISWAQVSSEIETSIMLTDAVTQTKRTHIPNDLAKFAQKQAETLSIDESALEIFRYIHSRMSYLPGQTGVHTVAAESWAMKAGVCQDFAHLAIGALRAIGIPARYVSGYLHPDLEPKQGVTVVGESHAWVEWFSGDWKAYDPTNDVHVQDRHISVARGRDYEDVAPLRGVFAGRGVSELFVSVEITREA